MRLSEVCETLQKVQNISMNFKPEIKEDIANTAKLTWNHFNPSSIKLEANFKY